MWVFRKTLLHEFHLSYSHTEWYVIFFFAKWDKLNGGRFACQKLANLIYRQNNKYTDLMNIFVFVSEFFPYAAMPGCAWWHPVSCSLHCRIRRWVISHALFTVGCLGGWCPMYSLMILHQNTWMPENSKWPNGNLLRFHIFINSYLFLFSSMSNV